MSQHNTDDNNYKNDEIDLKKLFQSIGKGISNIGRSFISLIIGFRRLCLTYKYLLLTSIVIGGIVGSVYNNVGKTFYKTSMLLSSEYFNARLIESSIEKLNTLCEEEGRLGLAKALNVEVEVAENIKGFYFEPMVSEKDIIEVELLKQKLEKLKVNDSELSKIIDQIQIQNKSAFIISVSVFDNKIVSSLQEPFVNFFIMNPYVNNRIKINKKNRLELIAKLQDDLIQLDSLKKFFNLNMRANAGRKSEPTSSVYVGESGSLDPTSFYNQSVSIYRQLQNVQKRVELGDDFEVLDGFTTFSNPESIGLKKSILFGALVFLGIAYLIIFLIEINKYLTRIEKEGFKD